MYPANKYGLMVATCVFCGSEIEDAKGDSGYTGVGPDWACAGDFGCPDNPISGEDGVGDHRTKEELFELYRIVDMVEKTHVVDVERAMRENLYGGG